MKITPIFALIVLVHGAALAAPVESRFTVMPGLELALPGNWSKVELASDGVIFAATQQDSPNSVGVLAFPVPAPNVAVDRAEVDKGLTDALGDRGKIIQRESTTMLGLPAYAVTAMVETPEVKATIIRIMCEKDIKGYFFALQYSVVKPGLFASGSVEALASYLQLTGPVRKPAND